MSSTIPVPAHVYVYVDSYDHLSCDPADISARINSGLDIGRQLSIAARAGDTTTIRLMIERIQLNRSTHDFQGEAGGRP